MEFEWDAGNLGEIGWHRLYPAHVEDAMADPRRLPHTAYNAASEERRAIIGMTGQGLVIVVIYTLRSGRTRVVTAWPARGRDLRAYGRQAR